MKFSPRSKRLVSALLVAGALLVIFKSVRYTLQVAGADFVQFHFAGKLAAQGDISRIYDTTAYEPLLAALKAQNENLNEKLVYYFNRPAFAAFLYAPLAGMDFPKALASWTAFNIALLFLFAWKAPLWLATDKAMDFPIRACLLAFFPFHNVLVNGHDTILLALLLAFAIWRLKEGDDVIAGALMALGLMKPHLMWTLPLALAFDQRWKALQAFVVTGLGLAGLSAALVGRTGIEQWLALLRGPTTDYLPSSMVNLRGFYLSHGAAAAAVCGAVVVGLGAYLMWKGDWRERYAAALLIGPLINVHTYIYDYSLGAVAACLTAHRSWTVRLLILAPWMYMTVDHDGTPEILSIVAVLAGLAYVRLRESRSAEVVTLDEVRGSAA